MTLEEFWQTIHKLVIVLQNDKNYLKNHFKMTGNMNGCSINRSLKILNGVHPFKYFEGLRSVHRSAKMNVVRERRSLTLWLLTRFTNFEVCLYNFLQGRPLPVTQDPLQQRLLALQVHHIVQRMARWTTPILPILCQFPIYHLCIMTTMKLKFQ